MISNHAATMSLDDLLAAAPEEHSNRIETVVSTQPTATGPTMSSLLIAEITGKNHADVMRDIRNTLEQAEIGESKFAGTYTDSQNKARPCYLLPRRECDLVISGYSVKYRLAIIDRWHELEARPQPVALPSYAESLRQLADSLERNETLSKEVAILDGAIERISILDGSHCFRDAAKMLQMPPTKLTEWLQIHGWIHHRPGCSEWIGYQDRINQGLLVTKLIPITHTDGDERAKAQCRITPRGIAKIAKLLGRQLA